MKMTLNKTKTLLLLSAIVLYGQSNIYAMEQPEADARARHFAHAQEYLLALMALKPTPAKINDTQAIINAAINGPANIAVPNIAENNFDDDDLYG